MSGQRYQMFFFNEGKKTFKSFNLISATNEEETLLEALQMAKERGIKYTEYKLSKVVDTK